MWITLDDNCRKAPIIRENGSWPQPSGLWIKREEDVNGGREAWNGKTGGKDRAAVTDAPAATGCLSGCRPCRRTRKPAAESWEGRGREAERDVEEGKEERERGDGRGKKRRKGAFRHCAAEGCCAVLGKGGRRRVWATCSGIGLAERGGICGKESLLWRANARFI